jgi:hypothetical protein
MDLSIILLAFIYLHDIGMHMKISSIQLLSAGTWMPGDASPILEVSSNISDRPIKIQMAINQIRSGLNLIEIADK